MIFIEELWATPRILKNLDESECEDAKAFKAEYKRRRSLHVDKSVDANKPGNRLRLFGHAERAEGLEAVKTVPGKFVPVLNGQNREDCQVFVHAPFKDDIENADGRNDTSLVLQIQMEADGDSRAGLIMLGGDAGHLVWEHILERSDNDTVEWNLFLAPHHCSWSFFNDRPQEEHPDPKESSLEFLRRGEEGAWIVASCKPVKDDDDNPPHWKAAKKYRDAVGGDNFIPTGEHPQEGDCRPLQFRITGNGVTKMSAHEGPSSRGRISGTLAPTRHG